LSPHDPGVVDDEVQAAQCVRGLGKGSGDGCAVSDIKRVGTCLAAVVAHFGRDLFYGI
jgi:hypothetical protein